MWVQISLSAATRFLQGAAQRLRRASADAATRRWNAGATANWNASVLPRRASQPRRRPRAPGRDREHRRCL